MSNKQFGITVFSVAFGVTCIIWGVLWMMMCLDYKEQVGILEKEITQLKWENENNYMYCLNDGEINE